MLVMTVASAESGTSPRRGRSTCAGGRGHPGRNIQEQPTSRAAERGVRVARHAQGAGGVSGDVSALAGAVRRDERDNVKRLKELDVENVRLNRIAAHQTLENAALKEIAAGPDRVYDGADLVVSRGVGAYSRLVQLDAAGGGRARMLSLRERQRHSARRRHG